MKRFLRHLAAIGGCLASVTVVLAQNRTFTNQYSFGDSLSDSGNIYTATLALGAPNPPAPYFQGRFSNGRVFTELLGNSLSLVVASPASVRSSLNFAFGGANASGTTALPPSLGVQVGLFQQRGIQPQRTDLFTVLAGPNDMIPVLSAASTPGNPAALDVAGVTVAQSVATNVQALIGLGAKNVVVLGMPNLGATPRALSQGGAGGPGSVLGLRATNAFNNELRSRLQTIMASPLAGDVDLVYTDLQGIIDRLALDYRAFGYNNAASYYLAPTAAGGGSGDPNGYIFWDDIHPTAKTHAILAAIVTEQLNPEIPLGFSATLGSAGLALESLASSAIDARASQVAVSSRPKGRTDVFATFNYGDGDRARDGWRPKFKYKAQVFTAGGDLQVADGIFFGGALNAGRLNADLRGGQGDFTVEDGAGRLYGIWRGGPVSLLIDANYGTLSVKGIHRTTGFGGLQTNAKTGGDHWGVGLKAAWAVDLGVTSVRPWFGLRSERVRLDGYAERDVPALSMQYLSQDAESTSGAVGIDLARNVKLRACAVRFDLRGAWHGEIGSQTRTVAGMLANNFTRPTSLAVEDGDGSGVELGGAATLFFRKNWSGSLGYAADIRRSEKLASRVTLSVQSGF